MEDVTDLVSASSQESGDADDRATFFDVLLLSDSNFQGARAGSIPPSSSCSPAPEISPVPDQTETLRRK